MTSAASNAWMPTGRHEVNIGTSLMRTLRARKGGPVKSSKGKHDREFYSFRYNFKPESVDATKPGSIEIKRAKEDGGPSSVNVVRPSTQNDHGVSYSGQVRSVKDVDCVLIYDEDSGTFTLEKVESQVNLQHENRPVHAIRPTNALVPPAPQRAPAAIAKREEEEESEGEIPEPPKPKSLSRPTPAAQPKVKSAPPAPQPAPRAPPPSLPPKPASAKVPPKPVSPVLPPPKPTQAPAAAKPTPPSAPPKPRPKNVNLFVAAKAKATNKRPAEEETLEVRRTQPPPPKKQKVVPEKREPVALALPGSGAPPTLALPSTSSAVAQPPSLSLPTSSSFVTLPPAPVSAPVPSVSIPEPSAPAAAVTDSDEEEWIEVQPTLAVPVPMAVAVAPAPVVAAMAGGGVPAPLAPREIVMEEIEPSAFTPPPRADGDDGEEQEIDIRAFEEELLEQLGDPGADADADAEMAEIDADPDADADVDADGDGDGDGDEDDFLAGAMSPVERQPVSLSRYAGGGPDFGDDDDYSSSDESDED
ncbi:RNA polymerase II transcription elongation factor-domain-containing protein [Trametes gibbosa]|nr:RNA polymerase II transcription elongation factor-domain-containing protein [Trametes gibbosa]